MDPSSGKRLSIKKNNFQQNMTIFLATNASILNLCQDWNVHIYAAKKEDIYHKQSECKIIN